MLLLFLAWRCRKRKVLLTSLIIIALAKLGYNSGLWLTWDGWFYTGYITYFFLLVIALAVVWNSRESPLWVVIGFVSLTVAFFSPIHDWIFKYSLARTGLYWCLIPLTSIVRADWLGPTRPNYKRNYEAFSLWVFAMSSGIFDAIKQFSPDGMKMFIARHIDPDLFTIALLIWLVSTFQRKPIPIIGAVNED